MFLSDKTHTVNLQYLAKYEKQLAREQKILARRRRRLKLLIANCLKTVTTKGCDYKVAKLSEEIASFRKDLLLKITFNIIEGLNVEGMVKNRCSAKDR